MSGSVVSMKTGIHISYTEMITAFETRFHEHLNKAINIVASFVIIKVMKPFNVFAVGLTV